MKRWLIRILVLLVLVAAAVWFKPRLFPEEPVPVQVVELTQGRVESTVTNSRAGTIRTRRRAKLSPEIGGRVVALPHREGERVAEGVVVLRLEDDVYRARLLLAERDVDTARAERESACLAAERAQRELERNRRLAGDGIIATDLIDQLESGAETAEAACRAARASAQRAVAAVDLARTELDKTVLRAPFDAVVADVSIELGEWATPSPPAVPVPPVVDLIDTQAIYISAPMDEVDAASLRAGLDARVTVDSHRGQTYPGRVIRVAPYVLDVEQQNRTVEIEVELEDSSFASSLLPGTSADVEVILEVREDVLRVPTVALMEGGEVLVLEDGRLATRSIETGLGNWQQTEVVSGVSQGTKVVTSLDRTDVKAGVLASEEGLEADAGAGR